VFDTSRARRPAGAAPPVIAHPARRIEKPVEHAKIA
jgi:hypothetical protein